MGWSELAQRPEFDEFMVVLKSVRYGTAEDGSATVVRENHDILTSAGELVQYSSPEEPGADYVSVYLPAFAPKLPHRNETLQAIASQGFIKIFREILKRKAFTRVELLVIIVIIGILVGLLFLPF